MASGYYCSDHVGVDGKGGFFNAACVSSLLCSDNWSSLVKDEYGAKYAIGGPTIEMWMASWNGSYNCLYCKGGAAGYVLSSDGDVYNATLKLSGAGYGDSLYFPHQSFTGLNLDGGGTPDDECWGYWIASEGAGGVYDLVCISSTGFVANVNFSGNQDGRIQGYGLRPLVCLEYGVKLAS